MRIWRKSNPSDIATCAEVMRSLQAFLDGEIRDELSARRIAAHLEVCQRCGMEVRTFRELKTALKAVARDIDPATIERLKSFARSLGEEQALDA